MCFAYTRLFCCILKRFVAVFVRHKGQHEDDNEPYIPCETLITLL